MLDGISKQQKKPLEYDYALAKFILKHKKSSALLSKKFGKVRNFTTRDSKLYLTQAELTKIRRGEKIDLVNGRLDCAFSRQKEKLSFVFQKRREERLLSEIKKRYASFHNYLKDALQGYTHGVSLVRAWNLSLISSLIFGMFLMTMIYRYLGPGAQAKIQEAKEQAAIEQQLQKEAAEKVLGENIAKAEKEKKIQAENERKQAIADRQSEFERKIKEMVDGHPIEKMAPYIAKEDPLVAAFFIAIARKESAWGERVPVNGGKDCYNYVGFRLKTEKMGSDGHSCFSSPKEGFEVTVKRMKNLIYKEKMTTAQKMVSPWKCGYDCSWDNPQAVQKWVSDVDYYLKQVLAWKIEGNR